MRDRTKLLDETWAATILERLTYFFIFLLGEHKQKFDAIFLNQSEPFFLALQVSILFSTHNDLLTEFTYFLPESQSAAEKHNSANRRGIPANRNRGRGNHFLTFLFLSCLFRLIVCFATSRHVPCKCFVKTLCFAKDICLYSKWGYRIMAKSLMKFLFPEQLVRKS